MSFSLPRTVVVLGLVSFFNDAASEMIAPLLPLFLTVTLGGGPAVVGLVEGLAEAAASLLKLVSGRLADRGWNHKGLVLGGYGVSNAVRPLIGLALASVPEAFLVLWASARGLDLAGVSLMWAAANGVKALVAAPAGAASDRFGRLPVLAVGWVARFGILIGMALSHTGRIAIAAFFLAYAASVAATEGAERALVGDVASSGNRATAYGLYHMVVGLAALPGALLFGALWQWSGEATAFFSAAALGLLSTMILLRLSGNPEPNTRA